MAVGSAANRARLVRRMRRTALFGLIAGALVAAAFLRTLLEGRSLPGPELAFVLLGAGILAVSIRILMPSYPQSVERRLARMEAMAEEQRRAYLGRLFTRQLVVVVVVLIIEIVVGALFWSFTEWRAWIVAGFVDPTPTMIVLEGVIILASESCPSDRAKPII